MQAFTKKQEISMASATGASTAVKFCELCYLYPSSEELKSKFPASPFFSNDYLKVRVSYGSHGKSNFDTIAELMANMPIPLPCTKEAVSQLLHRRYRPMKFLDDENQQTITSLFFSLGKSVVRYHGPKFPSEDEIDRLAQEAMSTHELDMELYYAATHMADWFANAKAITLNEIEDFLNKQITSSHLSFVEDNSFQIAATHVPTLAKFFGKVSQLSRSTFEALLKASH